MSCRSGGGTPRDHLNLGLALLADGRASEALAALETARQLAPQEPRVYFALGILEKREGRYPRAADALERARKLAPRDVPTLFNLGVVYSLVNRSPDALACFDQVIHMGYINAPPFYVAALFRSFTLLNRSGRKPEAQKAFAEYQELEKTTPQSGSARALESGPFLQMEIDAGPASTAPNPPARYSFETVPAPSVAGVGLAAGDFDQDGTVDLLVANNRSPSTLLLNRGKANFHRVGLPPAQVSAFGDIDNDGHPDIFLGGPALHLFRNRGDGTLEDSSAKLPVGNLAPGITLHDSLFFDYDVDGDLDLLLVTSAGIRLFRNDAPGGFTDVTRAAGLDAAGPATRAAFADFDGDNSPDLVVAGEDGVHLLLNQRNGTFRARRIAGPASSLAVADFDADGRFDVALLSPSGVSLLRNLGSGNFAEIDLPNGRFPAPANASLTLLDYDRDGLTDILVTAGGNAYAGRNLGLNRWSDISQSFSLPYEWKQPGGGGPIAADLFADGRFHLARCSASGTLELARNTVPENHAWLKFSLEGMRSNRLGIGATVELKAGNFYHKTIVGNAPLLVGAGDLRQVDVARVTWPNGVLMNQIHAATNTTLRFREANRLASSCPLLYVWNGSEFTYVTDTLGNAPLGTPDGKGGFWLANNRELTSVPDGLLQPRDGRYEIRLTEELREVTYLDRVRLLAVDHPTAHAVYTNDRYAAPPYPTPQVYEASEIRPVRRATDHHGHDLTRRLREVDGDYAGDFALSQISGLAAETHSLTLELGDFTGNEPSELYLTGWVYWMDSNGLVAAGAHPVMPFLQAPDRSGRWKTIIPDLGLPTGTGKSVRVNLRGKFPANDYRVRLVSNLCVYWDQIRVADSSRRAGAVRELSPIAADIHFRGFSEVAYDEQERRPDHFDYQHLLANAPWDMHRGRYTRYGDIRQLLAQADDLYVIMGAGDEIALSFDTASLPPLPPGWQRSFFLDSTGWVKDGEPNTAHGQTVEPLPFRAMKNYPPGRQSFSDSVQRAACLREYQTRLAAPLIAPLAPVR